MRNQKVRMFGIDIDSVKLAFLMIYDACNVLLNSLVIYFLDEWLAVQNGKHKMGI